MNIPLNQKGVIVAHAVIDDADEPIVRGYKWHLSAHGYAVRYIGEDHVAFMHREILGLTRGDGKEVDHANRDKLDNRRRNIRVVTHQQNCQNLGLRSNNKSGVRGVCWDKSRNLWKAGVRVGGRTMWERRFADKSEAAEQVKKMRKQLGFLEGASS